MKMKNNTTYNLKIGVVIHRYSSKFEKLTLYMSCESLWKVGCINSLYYNCMMYFKLVTYAVVKRWSKYLLILEIKNKT